MKKKEIHEFRKQVDHLIGKSSVEFSKLRENYSMDKFREVRAIDKVEEHLIEAKMWLGKLLEAKGSELPKEFRDNHDDNKISPKEHLEEKRKRDMSRIFREMDEVIFGEREKPIQKKIEVNIPDGTPIDMSKIDTKKISEFIEKEVEKARIK